jgi:hypothetical protein
MTAGSVAPPPLYQLGYVHRDTEAALNYWTRCLGVGPFYRLPHIPYHRVIYRGDSVTVDCTLYIAYWGDVQIELVEQHNDGPSLYKEFLAAGLDGLHHVCYQTDDLEAARADSLARGGEIVQELVFAGGGGIYVDFGGGPGSFVEILQAPPETTPIFDRMRDVSATWDGTEPLRRVPRPTA